MKLLFNRLLPFALVVLCIISMTLYSIYPKNAVEGNVINYKNSYTIETDNTSLSHLLRTLSISIIRQEQIATGTVYYGITPFGSGSFSNEYNCQIADTTRGLTIGFPLIEGGY